VEDLETITTISANIVAILTAMGIFALFIIRKASAILKNS